MTVTNTSNSGCGIDMMNAKVELMNVTFKGCGHAGLCIPSSTSETTVVATRCEFANSGYMGVAVTKNTIGKFTDCRIFGNGSDGIYVNSGSTIHLYGEATAIYSNGEDGIFAHNSGKVIIHLPSHHNTSYNNEVEDRKAFLGGTITNVED